MEYDDEATFVFEMACVTTDDWNSAIDVNISSAFAALDLNDSPVSSHNLEKS